MLKNVTIRLSGPICRCSKKDLSWGVICPHENPGDGHGLIITCKTCKVELRIPHDQYVASIVCDAPYPADVKSDVNPHEPKQTGAPMSIEAKIAV